MRAKSRGGYSIESLFEPFDQIEDVQLKYLPCELTGIRSLFKLLLFCFRIKGEVVHISGDVHYMAILLFWKKIVLTIHDLNFYEELAGVKRKVYGFIWFYLPIKLSNKIVVISPYTEEQLMHHFSISPRKVEVVPNFFRQMSRRTVNYNRNFTILCVGKTANKNQLRLIEAVKDFNDCQITFIGKQRPEVMDLLKVYKVRHVIRCNLSFEELELEYVKADMLFFASTREGFGLPILEGQSVGLPILTSTTTAMPFVAGNGALLVNPLSSKEIKEGIIAIKQKTINLKEMKEKGFENLKRFSFETFVGKYLNIYRNL